MGKIYILEGPDGTGKSTLANAIAEQTKGHVLHCSYDKNWNIQRYHAEIMNAAVSLSQYQDVVIDRWAPSEWVYGNVFREEASYDVFRFIESYNIIPNLTWIMCRNDNAAINHLKNSEIRDEMFNDMTDVVANFTLFKHDTSDIIDWIEYDFDKVNMNEFVKELTK